MQQLPVVPGQARRRLGALSDLQRQTGVRQGLVHRLHQKILTEPYALPPAPKQRRIRSQEQSLLVRSAYLFALLGRLRRRRLFVFFEVHGIRSEEHTSELQSLMRISYAVFCLKKKNTSRHT